MSLLSLAGGALLYPRWRLVRAGVDGLLARAPVLSPDRWYDRLVFGANRASVAGHAALWVDRLRTYASWTLGGVVTLGALGYAAASVAITLSAPHLRFTLVVVLLVAVLGALAAVRAPSHVAGIVALSAVGFAVTVFFVLAHAPDVALTQVVVETVSFVVFVAVLDHLPSFYGRISRSRAARDGALALCVGGLVTLTTLLVTSAHPDTIAAYFVENAVEAAGGHNLVNVILVDFRGFDTMAEVVVIALAAVTVLTLVVMRERGEAP